LFRKFNYSSHQLERAVLYSAGCLIYFFPLKTACAFAGNNSTMGRPQSLRQIQQLAVAGPCTEARRFM